MEFSRKQKARGTYQKSLCHALQSFLCCCSSRLLLEAEFGWKVCELWPTGPLRSLIAFCCAGNWMMHARRSTFNSSQLEYTCRCTGGHGTGLYISANNFSQRYHISSIRCRSYCLFHCSFCAATIRGRLLFKGSIYFFGKSGDVDGWIRCIQVRRWWLLDAVSSMRSLSVLLSAVGTTHTTQTVLALAWWPSSEIIRTRVCMLCLLAAATIQGRSFFRSRDLDCAATIRGRRLFKEILYSNLCTLSASSIFAILVPKEMLYLR